jgi:hypothetical protein
MVSKFSPTKLGSKKVFLVESHVPSPTVMVLELYVLLPAGDSVSDCGAMTARMPPRAMMFEPYGKYRLSFMMRQIATRNLEWINLKWA